MPKALKNALTCGFLFIAIAAMGFFIYSHQIEIADYFKGRNYTPSPEMSKIRDSLKLTKTGTRIFNATNPVLDSRDDFNHDCDSSDPGVAVYGCFTFDNIYVYNIDSPELAGIRESTTAHELLHAVWARLSQSEKDALIPILELAYSNNKAALDKTLEAYNESERLNELYVRIGTQIKTLPEELEDHYSKIFLDQDHVVSFYETYITPFEKYNSRISVLSAEMETMKAKIDEQTANYEASSAAFSNIVADFNSCAATSGCFSSKAAFGSRRAELVAEQEALNSSYEELSGLIDSYNQKVDEYNSNIFSLDTLQNLANSNGKVESFKNEGN